MNIVSIPNPSRTRQADSAPHCATCRAAQVCIPARVGVDDLLAHLPTRRIRVSRDSHLFQAGAVVGDLFYAVHYGTIKYTLPSASGQPKISAFLMSGDLLGLDSIGHPQHNGSAVALENSEVCEIRCSDLRPSITLFHGILSKQIAHEQCAAHQLRNSGAGQRLAAFLLDLSWRYGQRGYSSQRFRLIMPRQDIANFLALTPECLSRALAQLRSAGLLEIDDREVTLLDARALRQLAMGTGMLQGRAGARAAP
ncbi:MAG: helix-turn-helix domain-containing protein [Pseudomonadota bacterium]